MASIIIKRKQNQVSRVLKDSRCSKSKRVADDEDELLEDHSDFNDLTPEELKSLKELLPYKDALIKIAKGEFEIEKIVEEDDEDEDLDNFDEDEEETDFEEDEDLESEDEDLEEPEEDDEEELETGSLEDSNDVNEAWKKRLNQN